jgi:hypothetical protein
MNDIHCDCCDCIVFVPTTRILVEENDTLVFCPDCVIAWDMANAMEAN